MSKYKIDLTEWSEWIESLLATLVTLRVFGTHFDHTVQYDPTEGYLPFIRQVSNRAPQLEYFAIFDGQSHYGKLVCGEWVLCDEARFPPAHAFAKELEYL
jgi:hypothetical protein